MTTRHQIELDMILFSIAAGVVGTVFALYFNHKPNIRNSLTLPVMQELQNPSPTLIPTPKIETSSQISPDGAKLLTMTVTTNKNTKTYAFTTSDGTNTNVNKVSIYTAILPSTENMSIPFNTWSPDNAYVFLQHNTASSSGVIAMKANDQPFADGKQYIDVTGVFNAKNTGNTYQVTTGWASPTLLIVNSTTQDGSKGPSYWVEIPSQTVIQLATQF